MSVVVSNKISDACMSAARELLAEGDAHYYLLISKKPGSDGFSVTSNLTLESQMHVLRHVLEHVDAKDGIRVFDSAQPEKPGGSSS